jgi:hypothetical protein
MLDLEHRTGDMDACGVDVAVLSWPPHGSDSVLDPMRALATVVNEEVLAAMIPLHERLVVLFALPLPY